MLTSLTFNANAPLAHRARLPQVLDALDRALPPSDALKFAVGPGGHLRSLADRASVVVTADLPLVVTNGVERRPVVLSISEIPGGLTGDGQPQLALSLGTPFEDTYVASADAVLTTLADTAGAWWGTVTPGPSGAGIALQATPACPPGLPRLDHVGALPSPAIPPRLGWRVWWSPAARAASGNPDDPRLSSAGSGYLLRILDEPLDLDRPEHRDALSAIYAAFPGVGRAPRRS